MNWPGYWRNVRLLKVNVATVEHIYPSDHRTAEGHFPGNPIIPGAVLLSDALRAIAISLGITLTLSRIISAKFHAPTRPGDQMLIEFTAPVAGRLRFTCAVKQKTVLTGEVLCNAISTTN